MDQNRRRFLRKVPDDLAFIQIERDEVGKVLNVSEGGLRFSSVSPVPKNLPVYFWFSFNLRDRIEAMGEVTWTDLSRTVGGLRFTQLSQAGREQIRKYLSRMRAELDVPDEDPISQHVLAGKRPGNGNGNGNGLDQVARFAAKARAYRPTFYRKGGAQAVSRVAPAPAPGTQSQKAREDQTFLSLGITGPRFSRVAQPPPKPPAPKINPPKARATRSILSLDALDRADLLKVSQPSATKPPAIEPSAIKIDPPKPPVDRLTLSLKELDPARFKITPPTAPGIEPPKVRTDLPAVSLEALQPTDLLAVVAPSASMEMEPPKVRTDLPVVSLEALAPSDLDHVVEPPAAVEVEPSKAAPPPGLEFESPKAPTAASTLSSEEGNLPAKEPADSKVTPPPGLEFESPKAPAASPFSLMEVAEPEVFGVAPPALGIEPQAQTGSSVFSLDREPVMVPPSAPETESPKAGADSSVFSLEREPVIVPPSAPEMEPPKASADSSVFSLDREPVIVPPPAPETKPPKAPGLRPAFALEETNLADSKVAIPPALGIEPKSSADRAILSLDGGAAKESKASSRPLRGFERGFESLVTGLVPLQKHLMAKKRQLFRGMILGMCISTAVTVPTVRYWNSRAQAENIRPAPMQAASVKTNDAPTMPLAQPTQPTQPAMTKPSANNVGNVFSGNPAPTKWTTPDPPAKKQAASPYLPQALKSVVAKIPKPPAGPFPQSESNSTPGEDKTAGKKSMTPTQLWGQVQKGSSTAAVALAELYIKGDGVPQSCQQARVLLLIASEKRNTAAIKRLHDLDNSPACP
jgi:PilZ domain-containing protein